MIISLKWLKDYIDLDDLSLNDIVEKLTTSGSEVEEIHDKSQLFKSIVVGEIKTVKKHPNADKLYLCEVFDGNETLSVVCGASNVSVGQKVPLAKIGAIIPNGRFVIKSSKIRGEVSNGMICAEDELGLSNDHSGIMVLPDTLKIGQPFAEALNLDDVVLDIAITPNRADLLSHIGIARELGALFNRKVVYPNIETSEYFVKKNQFAEVIVENQENCPRYSAVILRGIKVQNSPDWLKNKIKSIGLRPINNVVDVTNFVLHEVGQPLHAFDLDKLSGNKIIVRNNNSNNSFTTLDSKNRSMLPNDLMICDGRKPVAIAGIMGGENSEVTATTKNILIESAYFNPSAIRKTAKRLGLSTDASYRFERGCDPNITIWAAQRAANLINQIAGGVIVTDLIDVYYNVILERTVDLRLSRINKILGFSISKENVIKIFESLGFTVNPISNQELQINIPTFRNDITREIDLIEEIVRVFGFENIPTLEKIQIPLNQKIDQTYFENKIRNILINFGFNENYSNSLLSYDKTIDKDRSLKVLNPQSTEMTNLRTSLLTGLLMNISRNINFRETNLKFFEIGHVFKSISKNLLSFNDFAETQNCAIILTGKKREKSWRFSEEKFDFFDLKNYTQSLLEQCIDSKKIKFIANYKGNEIFSYFFENIFQESLICSGGKLNQKFLDTFGIEQDVYFAEFNLEELKIFSKETKNFKQLLKYPKVFRDFAIIVEKNITFADILQTIKQSSSKLLKNVNLFDIFESESLGKDKISFAFKLEYFDENKTLREEEIDEEFWQTIEFVKNKLNAELRGS